ncbi:MAG: hypothetical protein Q9181_001804 [Wetmoreana brouardii]
MRQFSILLTLVTLITTSLTAPVQSVEERHILTETRQQQPQQQQDIPQLLTLASLAGITLPTDPAVLLSLGPVAARLQSYLPTSSVLSVLETAAPQSFLSNIVHDPAYAMSFEEAFAKGSSPSWFLALPTDVKSYLHTYSGYGDVATAVGDLESVTRASMGESGTGSRSGGSMATMTGSGSSQTSGVESTILSGTVASGTNANAQSTSSSTGGATRPTGPLALEFVWVVGLLGFAIGL